MDSTVGHGDPVTEFMARAFSMPWCSQCGGHIIGMRASAEEITRLRSELAEYKQDAERYRWLTYDHDDAEQRKRCREIWDCGCVMSYSALSVYIDAAMAGGE